MEYPPNKAAEFDALAAQYLGQVDEAPNPYQFTFSAEETNNHVVDLAEKSQTIEKMLLEVDMSREELREVIEWVLGINVEINITETGIEVTSEGDTDPKPLATLLEEAGAEKMEQFLEIIHQKLSDKATGEREKLHEGLLQLRQMSHDTEMGDDGMDEVGGKATRRSMSDLKKRKSRWERLRRRLLAMRGRSGRKSRDKDDDEDGKFASADDGRDKDGDGKISQEEERNRTPPLQKTQQKELQKTKSYISRIEHVKDALMGLKTVMQAAKNQKMTLQKGRENFDQFFKKGDKEAQRDLKILQSAQDVNLQQLKAQKTPGMEERAKQGLSRGQGGGDGGGNA